MDHLNDAEEKELYSLLAYIRHNVEEGRSRWKGDIYKVSGLSKLLHINSFIKESLREQNNQGLSETSGSGGSGDAV